MHTVMSILCGKLLSVGLDLDIVTTEEEIAFCP